MAVRSNKQLMRQVQRRMAIEVARAYRTVAYEAVLILAGIPPFELLAQMYAEVYQRTKRLREGGTIIIDKIRVLLRKQAWQALIIKWQRRLYDENLAGQRVVAAIRPLLNEWLEVQRMRGTFHTTQDFSGHGCFGDYLCRIGKEETARCHHCDGERDSAQHTLQHCPAWTEQRRILVQDIGSNDLSLSAIIPIMVEREEAWRAFASFCGVIMSQKEADERIRRGEQPAEGQPRARRAGTMGPPDRRVAVRRVTRRNHTGVG
ncbi:uncharacterized protein LOC115242246 [Formica exsecta]|uniref:uncharacterized protein LOC115242246 n=1 Tax=Formica exsecta TaxID=72781 RepID=UPI001141DA82|nr:uncharacterized protein LOC115242246 [Formica exsecta]